MGEDKVKEGKPAEDAKKASKAVVSSSRKNVSKPLDFGWKEITKLEDIVDKPIEPYKGPKDKVYKRQGNNAFQVGNNMIATLAPLSRVIDAFFFSREHLQWLDVSNNKLTSIEPVITMFPNLVILYMHGNEIAKLKEINKLGTLKSLKKLTLHANPVEEVRNYRMHVCTVMPRLTMLDFIDMTKLDRDRAQTWDALKCKPKD